MIHRYMSQLITDCDATASRGSCPGTGKGWHIRITHHPTGMLWSEQECPWYPSLAAAKEAIRDHRTGGA